MGGHQYYLPEDRLNRTKKPRFKLEYLTHKLEELHPEGPEGSEEFQYPVLSILLVPPHLAGTDLILKYIPRPGGCAVPQP